MDRKPLDFSSMTASLVGDPKRTWPREVDDFVPWLVDHLDALGAELGMGLSLVGTEVAVGKLRADLVAAGAGGQRVIIEAQYGPSDHKHLGQLVTYACAGDADVLVWVVVGDPWRPLLREEHSVTLTELNKVFAGRCEFHAVEVTVESEPVAFDALSTTGPLLPRLRRRVCASMQM